MGLPVQPQGNRRDFGRGSCKTVDLAEAHERALVVRRQVEQGYDPQFGRRKIEAVSNFRGAAKKVVDIRSQRAKLAVCEAPLLRTSRGPIQCLTASRIGRQVPRPLFGAAAIL